MQFDDLSVELETVRAGQRDLEKKQRRHDQLLTDERTTLAAVAAERDTAQQDARDKESKLLSLTNEVSASNSPVAALMCSRSGGFTAQEL